MTLARSILRTVIWYVFWCEACLLMAMGAGCTSPKGEWRIGRSPEWHGVATNQPLSIMPPMPPPFPTNAPPKRVARKAQAAPATMSPTMTLTLTITQAQPPTFPTNSPCVVVFKVATNSVVWKTTNMSLPFRPFWTNSTGSEAIYTACGCAGTPAPQAYYEVRP